MIINVDEDECKRETCPVGRIQTAKSVYDKFFTGFNFGEAHENHKTTDDKKKINTHVSHPEVKITVRSAPGKMKENNH